MYDFAEYAKELKKSSNKPPTETWVQCLYYDEDGNPQMRVVPKSYCLNECPEYSTGYFGCASHSWEREVQLVRHDQYIPKIRYRWQKTDAKRKLIRLKFQERSKMVFYVCKGCIHLDHCVAHDFDQYARWVDKEFHGCLNKEVICPKTGERIHAQECIYCDKEDCEKVGENMRYRQKEYREEHERFKEEAQAFRQLLSSNNEKKDKEKKERDKKRKEEEKELRKKRATENTRPITEFMDVT